MDLHDRPVRREPELAKPGGLGAQLRHGELGESPLGPRTRKHRLGVEADRELLEAVFLVGRRIRRVGDVLRAVEQDDVDEALLAIDDHAPAFRDEDVRPIRVARVRQEDIRPSVARGRDLADVQHPVWKGVVKDARLHLTLRLVGHRAKRDLTKRLVGVREGDDHDVAGRGGGADGQERQGCEHAIDADAARLQGHGLPVGRHPA